jgi:NADH-quinone oxidoreductase subunit J
VTALFYIAAVVAVIATALVITRTNLVHALLYLVISLLAVAVLFYSLGATFVAALEAIVYAGAIMVLFLFAVMLLELRGGGAADGGPATTFGSDIRRPGRGTLTRLFPAALVVVLLVELVYAVARGAGGDAAGAELPPRLVGVSLFTTYALGVELASMLLLAGLIGARHLGQRAAHADDPAVIVAELELERVAAAGRSAALARGKIERRKAERRRGPRERRYRDRGAEGGRDRRIAERRRQDEGSDR